MSPKKRRLTDLFVIGDYLDFDDGKGENVRVWVQKPNPNEQEDAVRKASAARAPLLMDARDTGSEFWRAAYSDVSDYNDRATVLNIVVGEDLTEARMSAEARVADEEQWKEDGYLQGLYDAWNDGMQRAYLKDNEDPEAKRVWDELNRFNTEVEELVAGEEKRLEREYEGIDDAVLYEKAATVLCKQRALNGFIKEYDTWLLMFGVRDPEDHTAYYFMDRVEVKQLDDSIRLRLIGFMKELVVDPVEGKDSEGAPDSSTSSEPSEEAPVEPSGPAAVIQ